MFKWVGRLFNKHTEVDNTKVDRHSTLEHLVEMVVKQNTPPIDEGVLARNPWLLHKIEDDAIFQKMSDIVEKGLQGEVVSIVSSGSGQTLYSFGEVDVLALSDGHMYVRCRGVLQELGGKGKRLFNETLTVRDKRAWEEKLKEVFGGR